MQGGVLMYQRKVKDFHRPKVSINESGKPAAEVAAPNLKL